MGLHLEEKTLEYLQIYKIDIQVTFKTACFALKKKWKKANWVYYLWQTKGGVTHDTMIVSQLPP